MNNKFCKVVAVTLVAMIAFGCKQASKKAPVMEEYYVAAYIWPSCHNDPKGREHLWNEGIGEWEVINKGNPRFEGHYQPKQPLWGYEPDNDPNVVEKWIDAATDHGVNVFIYDWYWYDNGPFLESALNDGFLKARNNEKMYFYIMWANHDVRKYYWNYHLHGDDTSILWDASVDWENYKVIVERVIRQYFCKPNYFKIDGQPVFSIYVISKLLQSFGGSVDETRKRLDYFRDETKKAGFPGLHLQTTVNGNPSDSYVKLIEALGINSLTHYNWSVPYREDYLLWGKEGMDRTMKWGEVLSIPFFPNVSIGYDDSPRFPEKGSKDIVHYHQSPESFASFLQKAKEFCDARPQQPKLITVFAWNEWVEGSYLLPDMKYGFGYLEALRDVMNGKFAR